MNELHHTLNALASLIAAAGLSYVVLSSRVKEGLVIKAGLVAMIFGLLGTAYFVLSGIESWRALWWCGFLLRGGLAVVIMGYLLRRRRAGHALMRSADWIRP